MTSSTGGSKAARNYAGIMMVLGIFFIVLAVVNLFLARMIDAAWCFTIGFGNVVLSYAQTHYDLNEYKGKAVWVLAIAYAVIIAVLTFAKLTWP
jgi:hypothetical protein